MARKNLKERTINGERCLSTSMAQDEFMLSEYGLAKHRKDGMPHYVSDGNYWYPLERCQAWFRGEEDTNMQHKVSEVICLKCLHRWIAVRPVDTKLKQLECPECRLQGYAIETGEELREAEE